MIPQTPAPTCDACKQPIDLAKGYVSLQPLRGGLTLVVATAQGNAGQVIDQRLDFCDSTCFEDHLKSIRAQIKAPTAPTAAPAAKPAA